MDLLGVSPWATFNKQLLDEVFLVSRIIKASVRVIVLLYIERILSFSLRHKMFSKFVPTLSFPQVPSVFFSLSRNRQTASLPPSSTFLCFVSPSLQLCFRCPARPSTKQTLKSCFCFFTDGKQHKAHELDMITLRNHAPRSYMKSLPVTLSVLDMIIV